MRTVIFQRFRVLQCQEVDPEESKLQLKPGNMRQSHGGTNAFKNKFVLRITVAVTSLIQGSCVQICLGFCTLAQFWFPPLILPVFGNDVILVILQYQKSPHRNR